MLQGKVLLLNRDWLSDETMAVPTPDCELQEASNDSN
jgi:hypothetical protein